jgi:hypothetical protein
MFTIYYKLFHFANNLIFLSPIQETNPIQDFFENILKIIIDEFYFSKLFEEITKAVSPTPTTPQSNVAY